MDKKMIIAIVLSLVVLFAFQMFAPKRPVKAPLPQKIETTEAVPQAETPVKYEKQKPRKTEKETETTILTGKYELIFSNIGGSLKGISLIDGEKKETIYTEENPSLRSFAVTSGLVSGLDKAPFTETKGADFIEYTYTEPGILEVRKRYNLHNSLYIIGLELSFKNLSTRAIDITYKIVGPSSLDKTTQVAGRSFLEADILIDGKLWRAKAAKGSQERMGAISWEAIKNRYYTVMLKPEQSVRTAVIQDLPNKDLLTAFTSPVISAGPGETIKQGYMMYAGPLNEKAVMQIDPSMGQIVNYGFFGGISKALLLVLRFFHSIVRNWGVAIIMMTILINLILFPLTYKSFASMHKMKKVQPHIQKLRELHKDNPQKLNKETMELYKEYNINPLGGCLPLLLQMPIFIALYQGLIRSIELKGAHFLWIKDLAKPDAVPIPVKLPLLGNSINILPLLMVGIMVVQQKLTQASSAAGMTEDQASQQKMMMLMMPLLFGFLFYRMPSGLVLYWLTNTILMTIEQTLISKRMAS